MLELRSVTKQYPTRHGRITVLNGVDLSLARGEKLGILGRNGSGKSTLIRVVGGVEPPTRGSIERTMKLSWPIAFAGGFQNSLTGLDNLRFICRVYDVSFEDKLDFVEDFAELGRFMREPVKTYSAGMLARLAFALSMAIEFDCFLIDEVISVGDQRFHEKCHRELFEKRGDRAMLMVSHEKFLIQKYCTQACVLDRGQLHRFDDIDAAYEFYSRL